MSLPDIALCIALWKQKVQGKERMTEETVITEQEVRNQRAMINDTILVGMCVGHY